jgi:anti-sigma factor RsiW
MKACDDLVAFADGELSDAQADAFRGHLSECKACRDNLVSEMQLGSRLSAASNGAEKP